MRIRAAEDTDGESAEISTQFPFEQSNGSVAWILN